MTENAPNYGPVPLHNGECQLLGWGESDSGGAWIKYRVLPEDLAVFRAKKGECHHLTIFRVEDLEAMGKQEIVASAPSPEATEAFRAITLAEKLHRDGYFRNPRLWAAMEKKGLYTQKLHKTYVESLPCHRPHPTACNGDVVMHHCRNAENSGMGIKPYHWYGLPLCHAHHDWQQKYATREENAKMLEAAVALTAAQIKRAMKAWLGIESLRELTQERLEEFEAWVYG